jgi:hypothetical protein
LGVEAPEGEACVRAYTVMRMQAILRFPLEYVVAEQMLVPLRTQRSTYLLITQFVLRTTEVL